MNIDIFNLLDYATCFEFCIKRYNTNWYIQVKKRSNAWIIYDAGYVLAKDGYWEIDPIPFKRDESFKLRTYYDTLDDAIEAVRDMIQNDKNNKLEGLDQKMQSNRTRTIQ